MGGGVGGRVKIMDYDYGGGEGLFKKKVLKRTNLRKK